MCETNIAVLRFILSLVPSSGTVISIHHYNHSGVIVRMLLINKTHLYTVSLETKRWAQVFIFSDITSCFITVAQVTSKLLKILFKICYWWQWCYAKARDKCHEGRLKECNGHVCHNSQWSANLRQDPTQISSIQYLHKNISSDTDLGLYNPCLVIFYDKWWKSRPVIRTNS